jgi:hypothetical protein
MQYGAEDIITKPINLLALQTRISAVLQRAHGIRRPVPGRALKRHSSASLTSALSDADMTVDPVGTSVSIASEAAASGSKLDAPHFGSLLTAVQPAVAAANLASSTAINGVRGDSCTPSSPAAGYSPSPTLLRILIADDSQSIVMRYQ